jgi:hypothetical protein
VRLAKVSLNLRAASVALFCPTGGEMEKPENIPEGDFANYFCTYGRVAGRPAPRGSSVAGRVVG